MGYGVYPAWQTGYTTTLSARLRMIGGKVGGIVHWLRVYIGLELSLKGGSSPVVCA